jgi:hypothetical protein
VSAAVSDHTVVLVDSSGAVRSWTPTAANTPFTPSADEKGSLSIDPAGRVLFVDEAGTTYTFDSSGLFTGVLSPTDLKHPASPTYTYGTNGQLTAIGNRLAPSQKITLSYGGDPACPASSPTNLVVAPAGNLCDIAYPDGSDAKSVTRERIWPASRSAAHSSPTATSTTTAPAGSTRSSPPW